MQPQIDLYEYARALALRRLRSLHHLLDAAVLFACAFAEEGEIDFIQSAHWLA